MIVSVLLKPDDLASVFKSVNETLKAEQQLKFVALLA